MGRRVESETPSASEPDPEWVEKWRGRFERLWGYSPERAAQAAANLWQQGEKLQLERRRRRG